MKKIILVLIFGIVLIGIGFVGAVQVWGFDSGRAWRLYRHTHSSGYTAGNIIANANCNTEDTSIAYATISNYAYRYWIQVSLLSSDRIYSARITYTT